MTEKNVPSSKVKEKSVRLLLVLLSFLTATALQAAVGQKVLLLPEVGRPESIAINGDLLCVSGENSALLHSLKEKKLVAPLGTRGQGPREYTESPYAFFDASGNIVVLSFMTTKLMAFSRTGKYLGEKKYSFFSSRVEPFGENYAVREQKFPRDENGKSKYAYTTVSLYDSNFQFIKRFAKKVFPSPVQKINVIAPILTFRLHGDKLYVSVPEDDVIIDVFDKRGEKIRTIRRDYKRTPITSKYKKWKVDRIKEWKKDVWHLLKDKLVFPEYFSALQDFHVDKDKIYVKSWMEKGDSVRFDILDMDGKLLKERWVPEVKELYTVHSGRYYYLVDSYDDESWALYVIDLD